MALPPSKVYKQDMPPPGGFPAVRYKKLSPQRGPSGLAIVLGAVVVSSAGLWYAIADNKEREYVGFCRCETSWPCI
jgi:NADH dehydrogenase (ubiquinone) 1 alpha subcomplex subunit 13